MFVLFHVVVLRTARAPFHDGLCSGATDVRPVLAQDEEGEGESGSVQCDTDPHHRPQ